MIGVFTGSAVWCSVLCGITNKIRKRISNNYLKKIEPERYCTMRRSIHRRLDILFENNLPFYLSEKSSGKNIVQYLGFDPEELT